MNPILKETFEEGTELDTTTLDQLVEALQGPGAASAKPATYEVFGGGDVRFFIRGAEPPPGSAPTIHGSSPPVRDQGVSVYGGPIELKPTATYADQLDAQSKSWSDFAREAVVPAVAFLCLACGVGPTVEAPKHKVQHEMKGTAGHFVPAEDGVARSAEEVYPDLDLDRIRQRAAELRGASSDAEAVSQIIGRSFRAVHQPE